LTHVALRVHEALYTAAILRIAGRAGRGTIHIRDAIDAVPAGIAELAIVAIRHRDALDAGMGLLIADSIAATVLVADARLTTLMILQITGLIHRAAAVGSALAAATRHTYRVVSAAVGVAQAVDTAEHRVA
jgi:hypothetical protein